MLFQADLNVNIQYQRDIVSLIYKSAEIELISPDLFEWRNMPLQIVKWRGILLPQVREINCKYPDVLGLLFYLSHDIEELRQEALYPHERYDIKRSSLRGVYHSNYVDQLIAVLKKELGLSTANDCGVILTHDLDFLSVIDVTRLVLIKTTARDMIESRPTRAKIGLLIYLGALLLRPWRFMENFEFLEWAKEEKKLGFRSVFFVFAHDRRKNFPGDAWYNYNYRDRKFPFRTLRRSLKALLNQGFIIGPHFSRSSNYEKEEILREYRSINRELDFNAYVTRNHWLWIKYSNWYDYLKELGVEFDFNNCAIGYSKGTSYPLLTRNYSTMTFPTTYLDDVVLKTKNLYLNELNALNLLKCQLDNLQNLGGCIAISFHPAEDGPTGTYQVKNKLEFYKSILILLRHRGIPVYTPNEAKRVFTRKVIFNCAL